MSSNLLYLEQDESISLNDVIIDSILDIKGKNIFQLDLRNLEDKPTDYFIICEGDSSTQIQAIANNIHVKVKESLGILPSVREGIKNAQWVLVDYFDTVVHIFHPEKRAFYDIEDLWSDAKIAQFDNI